MEKILAFMLVFVLGGIANSLIEYFTHGYLLDHFVPKAWKSYRKRIEVRRTTLDQMATKLSLLPERLEYTKWLTSILISSINMIFLFLIFLNQFDSKAYRLITAFLGSIVTVLIILFTPQFWRMFKIVTLAAEKRNDYEVDGLEKLLKQTDLEKTNMNPDLSKDSDTEK